MTIRDIRGEVQDLIKVDNVIVSVFEKTGLDEFVLGLMEINPDVRFLSTGGTYKKIKEVLGENYGPNLLEVAEFTEFPEMEGGLVKTLHPKIHAGLLGERNNPEHQRYLSKELNGGVYIDMVVVNLYPFQQVVSSQGVTFEKARGNIDIGGPTMIRAGAKNFPSCAVVCDPANYQDVLQNISANEGCTDFNMRLGLAKKVFETTATYDKAIAEYFRDHGVDTDSVRSLYKFTEGGK